MLRNAEIVIGIDPGFTGAIVAVSDKLEIMAYCDTPIINLTTRKKGKKSIHHDFAPTAMKDALLDIINNHNNVRIWLEAAHAMPAQGLSSTFKTGRGFGLWEGVIVGLGLSYDIVHARTWTKVVLKDIPAGDPKERSMIKAQRLFGSSLPLMKPKGRVLSLDGRADAALIAYYGLLELGKVQEQRPKRTAFRL